MERQEYTPGDGRPGSAAGRPMARPSSALQRVQAQEEANVAASGTPPRPGYIIDLVLSIDSPNPKP